MDTFYEDFHESSDAKASEIDEGGCDDIQEPLDTALISFQIKTNEKLP